MDPASYPLCSYAPGGAPATDPDLDTPGGPGGSCATFTHRRVRPAVVDELVALGATVWLWWQPPSWTPDEAEVAQATAEQLAAHAEPPTPDTFPDDPAAYGDLYYAVRLPAGTDPRTAAQLGFITRDLAEAGDAEPTMALNLTTTATGQIVLFGGLY